MVTDWLKTWVQFSFSVLDFRFRPARLTDDFALTVADVTIGVLQVFGFAGVIVNFQLGEETECTCHVK